MARRASVRAPAYGFGKNAPPQKKEDEAIEGLTTTDTQLMKEQFALYDNQNLGYINRYDLKGLLEACGESPSD